MNTRKFLKFCFRYLVGLCSQDKQHEQNYLLARAKILEKARAEIENIRKAGKNK